MDRREQNYKAALRKLRTRDFEVEKTDEIKDCQGRLEDANKSGCHLLSRYLAETLVRVMRSDPEQTRKQVKEYIAEYHAVKCFDCNRVIGDTVHFRYHTTHFRKVSICERCVKDKRWNDSGNCIVCGRTLIYTGSMFPSNARVMVNGKDTRKYICSEYCRNDYPNSQRAKRTETTCAHCGETFQQTRSDQQYCSTKCRVYANRKKGGNNL